jgi:hypothetical protein
MGASSRVTPLPFFFFSEKNGEAVAYGTSTATGHTTVVGGRRQRQTARAPATDGQERALSRWFAICCCPTPTPRLRPLPPPARAHGEDDAHAFPRGPHPGAFFPFTSPCRCSASASFHHRRTRCSPIPSLPTPQPSPARSRGLIISHAAPPPRPQLPPLPTLASRGLRG